MALFRAYHPKHSDARRSVPHTMVQIGRRGAMKASSKKTKKKAPARVQKAKLKESKREAARLKSDAHLSRGKFEKAMVKEVEHNATGPAIVLAHGAGSSSSHAAMKAWRSRLTPIAGKVFMLDYPKGHQMAQLTAAHAAAVTEAYEDGYREIILVGSGMGARVAVHLLGSTAGDDGEPIAPLKPHVGACVKAQVALGYPLTQVGSSEVRDAPLRALTADAPPLLFVSGTSSIEQLEVLERVRGTCAVPTTLCTAEGADHTLHSKVDTENRMASLVATIATFVAAHTSGLGRLVRKKKKRKAEGVDSKPEAAAAQAEGGAGGAGGADAADAGADAAGADADAAGADGAGAPPAKRHAPTPTAPTTPATPSTPTVPATPAEPTGRAAGALSELAAVEAASQSALAAVATAAPFQPAREFSVLREGYTYAHGPQGAGYYADRERDAAGGRVLFNGVHVLELAPGRGRAATPGQYVSVRYVGTLESGTRRFDAGTMHFRLGAGKVIKAWDTGVAGMCVGGKRKLVCPPRTAYGKRGSMPDIPPNATLRFDVELLKIKAT